MVCAWTTRTFWVNILRSSSEWRETVHLDWVNLFQNDFVSKRLVTPQGTTPTWPLTYSRAIVNHKHTLIGFVGVRVDPFLPRFKFIQPPVCDAYYPVIVDHTMTRGKITVKLDGTVVQILHALQRKFPFKVTPVSFKICISKGSGYSGKIKWWCATCFLKLLH